MKSTFAHLESNRLTRTEYASYPGDHFGCFIFCPNAKTQIRCIVDDGAETGWEHVSVSVAYRNERGQVHTRMPSWDEMCQAKDRFWNPEETVVQFHPAHSCYVTPHVLHLWKRVGQEYELPNHLLLGFTGDQSKDTTAAVELEKKMGGAQ